MKNKTIYIILGVIAALIVIFLIWRNYKQKQMALQAQLQQQQLQSQFGTTDPNQTNLSGTIDSVGGVLDSLTSLWDTIKGDNSGSDAGTLDQAYYNQVVNECEMLWNTDQQVQDCIDSKLNQA